MILYCFPTECSEPAKPIEKKPLVKQHSSPSLWSTVQAKKPLLRRQNTQPNLSVPESQKSATPPKVKPLVKQKSFPPARRRRKEMYFNRHRPLLLGPEQSSTGELFQILANRRRRCLITGTHTSSQVAHACELVGLLCASIKKVCFWQEQRPYNADYALIILLCITFITWYFLML